MTMHHAMVSTGPKGWSRGQRARSRRTGAMLGAWAGLVMAAGSLSIVLLLSGGIGGSDPRLGVGPAPAPAPQPVRLDGEAGQ
jgi:hypothetical protein